MTITAIPPQVVVDLDGSQGIIAFDFSIASVDELDVFRDGALLTRTVEYNLSLPVGENDGEVQLIAPFQAGQYVVQRVTVEEQTVSLSPLQRFPSSMIGSTFDKIIRLIQELSAKVNRSIRQSLFDSETVDARNLRISNVADAVDDQDAVSQRFLDVYYGNLPPGPQGPAGPAIPGPIGFTGPQGTAPVPLRGVVDPSATFGVDGQWYINTDNGDLWQRELGGWTLLLNLQGPPGSGGGGVTDHGALTGLTDADHPISAVQGLQNELDNLLSQIGIVSGAVPAVYRQDDAPTGTIPEGSLWFDSNDSNRMYAYLSGVWVDVRDVEINALSASLATNIVATATAQSTADSKIQSFVGPSEPVGADIGDFWVRSNDNRLFRYDGSAWVPYQDADIVQALTDSAVAQATADGKIVTFLQPTAPISGTVGDLWVDTDDDNHPYRWNGGNWVSIRDAAYLVVASDLADAVTRITTLEGIADGYVDITIADDAPVSPDIDDIWVETDNNNESFRWNGTVWESIRDGGISQAVTDSSNAIAVADQKVRVYFQNDEPDPGIVQIDTGDLWVDLNDSNRPYRWGGAAWIDANPLDGVIAGQVTSDGIANNALSEHVVLPRTPSTNLPFGQTTTVQSVAITVVDPAEWVEVRARYSFLADVVLPLTIRIDLYDDLGNFQRTVDGIDNWQPDDRVDNAYLWRVDNPGAGNWSYRIVFFVGSVAGGTFAQARDVQMALTRFKK